MSRRVNLPKLNAKLDRGQSEMACCKEGLLGVKWQDTKEVLAISNCHKANLSTTKRKLKDGTKKTVDCPEVMVDYNRFMGGVDLTDQMVTMYELDRRSSKWWRKVFYRLFMTAIYNSYVIHRELRHLDNFPFLDFLVEVAEGLIALGRSKVPNSRKRSRRVGRRSKKVKFLNNIGDHLPVHKGGRGRCIRCKTLKIEKRTQFICKQCEVPLCPACFTPYHT